MHKNNMVDIYQDPSIIGFMMINKEIKMNSIFTVGMGVLDGFELLGSFSNKPDAEAFMATFPGPLPLTLVESKMVRTLEGFEMVPVAFKTVVA